MDEPPPMRFALMLGREPVGAVNASSQVFVARDQRSLRYFAVLETTGLTAGTYTALSLLPSSGSRAEPYIYSTFTVIP